MTSNFAVTTFNNAFTKRCRFDGPPLNPAASIIIVGQGILSHLNLHTRKSIGDGTFYVTTVDLGPLSNVTWNGSVPGNTFNGTATLQFADVQPGIPQTISVEVTDIYNTTVKATAIVPVFPGKPLDTDPHDPFHAPGDIGGN